MTEAFSECVGEGTALARMKARGYAVSHGPEIAVGELAAKRTDPNDREVILERCLGDALFRLRNSKGTGSLSGHAAVQRSVQDMTYRHVAWSQRPRGAGHCGL